MNAGPTEFLVVLAILTLVVLVVSAPLRRAPDPGEPDAGGSAASELAELEAAREAKYREIRDAELDHKTGKLSDADYRVLDGELRVEAIGILRELDRARGTGERLPSQQT